jgi:hypothetical protein
MCRLRLNNGLGAVIEIGVLECGVNDGRKPLRADKMKSIDP